MPDRGHHHQVVVSRTGSMDELLVKVECELSPPDGFQKKVAEGLQGVLGVRADTRTRSSAPSTSRGGSPTSESSPDPGAETDDVSPPGD